MDKTQNENAPTRRSNREAKPTEKALLNREMQAEKIEKDITRQYDAWRLVASKSRRTLLGEISLSTIQTIETDLKEQLENLQSLYDQLKTVSSPSAHTMGRIENAQTITDHLLGCALDRRFEDGEIFSEARERARMRDVKRRHPSIFGDSISERSYPIGENDTVSESSMSRASSISSLKAMADAELAAKNAEVEALIKEEEQTTRLMEMEAQLKKEQLRLRRVKIESEAEAARAKSEALTFNEPSSRISRAKPASTSEDIPDPKMEDITRMLSNAIGVNRLPSPEPSVFTGDPLLFTRWSQSFEILIEKHCTTPTEKMFYLERYLAGEAKNVVAGTFFRRDDAAYSHAWGRLKERYGHPFLVQKAFRDKLNSWPKIGPKDASKLKDFSDFVTTCSDAIPHVPGLNSLNDYEHIQGLLRKLPDWITNRWNRKATTCLDDEKTYPTFGDFARFLHREARIACNPISSLHTLKGSETQEDLGPKKGKTLAFSTTINQENNSPACAFCDSHGHSLATCEAFRRETLRNRREFLQNERRCYGCLRQGHLSHDCQRKHICGICKRRHPTCLHDEDPYFRVRNVTSKAASTESSRGNSSALSYSTLSSHSSALTSNIVPVWISSIGAPSKERLVYAMLDTQSDSTFINEELCTFLQVETSAIKLKMSTMLGRDSTLECRRATGLQVRALNGDHRIPLPPSYTRTAIPGDPSHIPTRETAMKWNHLKGIAEEIPPLLDREIGILIGYNCPQALAPRQVLHGNDGEPFAVRTDLGWSVVGESSPSYLDTTPQGLCHRTRVKEIPPTTPRDAVKTLEQDFQEMNAPDTLISQNDITFMNFMADTIHRNEHGHYKMPLPFKSRPKLPDNKRTALVRLLHLKKKLTRDDRYREHYFGFMDTLFKSGHAEVISKGSTGEKWYIPHHGVYHPAKPDKLRVVFDCSSKHRGTSLNEHLLTGPDLTNSLLGVLLRFRMHPIAVLCDVEKMFHQFHVDPKDRNYLSFLWWEGNNLESEPLECRMKVHLFGAASSPGCANYGLKRLVEEHGRSYPLAANFVRRNFYVDDGITSVPTIETAKQLIQESVELCSKGNLKLHKFLSNNEEVMRMVEPGRPASNTTYFDPDKDAAPEKALGIRWSTQRDCFEFELKVNNHPRTRRSVLSIVASLYDPLGLIAPFALIGKRILQVTCKQGTKWDDPLPNDLQPEWDRWVQDLQNLNRVKIPRLYFPCDFGEPIDIQLHHFADASTKGYGSCSYLRAVNDEGQVHCALVFAKARVAPSKLTTIPRLELSAAVTSTKASQVLRREMDVNVSQEFFWTDSKVVLGYINNEAKRFHVFVANRIETIRQITSPSQWRYVSSEENPADLVSRGTTITELEQSRWFLGPSFLWGDIVHSSQDSHFSLLQDDPEVRTTLCLQTSTELVGIDFEEKLGRFSDWRRAIGAIARILRRARGIKSSDISSVQERKDAENLVIKATQQRTFSKEFAIISSSSAQLPEGNALSKFEPIVRGGMLRAGGRLKYAPISFDEIHPIILPRESQVTRLVISHCHNNSKHQGRGITINELRANGYCVIGGRDAVSKHIHKCVTCRKSRRPLEEQKMADLPKERVEASPPFRYSGMDCFGPYPLKRGRKAFKCYGLLFTCLYSRAVHLEMLEDMTSDSLINGLRCFIAVRGSVREIRCDQGTNFVGANNELRAAMKEMEPQRISAFLAAKQCDFVFNPPSSSHAGGVWERQIRTIRSVLTSTIVLGQDRMYPASLRTLFYEAMSIINNRPLSSCNSTNTLEALTPNHLLTLRASPALPPPGKFVKEDVYLRKRWRRVQYLTEQFWSRWKREYMYNISQRQKWRTAKPNLVKGSIVLVNEHTSRNHWPLARVLEAKPDKDGLVRKAKVLIGSQDLNARGKRTGKMSILERPIQKLVTLLNKESEVVMERKS